MDQNSRPVVLGPSSVRAQLEKLCSGAQQRLLLISPYFDIDNARVIEREIIAAAHRRVQVTLIVRSPDRTTKFKKATLSQLRELASLGVRLLCVRDLHAKLYASEKSVILTSLNLLDSSWGNNIEVGMEMAALSPEARELERFYEQDVKPHLEQLHVTDDEAVAKPLPRERVQQRTPAVSIDASPPRQSRRSTAQSQGFCIRCHGSIPLNPDKPYCRTDYERWAEYENPNYKDKYCHRCGEEHPATLRKPLCSDCYELSTET